MRTHRSKLSRLASWGLFLGALFTVGTGFQPGSLTRGGCERVKERYISRYTVTVVDDRTDAPLAGTSVTLGGDTRVTDAGGVVVFPDLFAGTFTVMAAHEGYQPYSASQTLTVEAPHQEIRLVPLSHGGSATLLVQDICTFQDDPLTMNRKDDPTLFFESSAATLAHQASAVTFVDLAFGAIPPGANVTRVILTGHLLADSGLGPGGSGGDDAPSRTHLTPRATADEDIALEAYGVLQTWSQDDLNFMNKPVDFTNDPVATGVVAASTPTDAAGLKTFTMDLTQFVGRVRSGALRAHGFFIAGKDIVGAGGAIQVLAMTSSEYLPAEGALRVVAEYTDATGKTGQVALR